MESAKSSTISPQDNPNEGLGGDFPGSNGDTVSEFSMYEGVWLGDVEMGRMRISVASGGTYKCSFALADGNIFTVERESLFHDLYNGKLTFEDCTKEYSSNAEYYYSTH